MSAKKSPSTVGSTTNALERQASFLESARWVGRRAVRRLQRQRRRGHVRARRQSAARVERRDHRHGEGARKNQRHVRARREGAPRRARSVRRISAQREEARGRRLHDGLLDGPSPLVAARAAPSCDFARASHDHRCGARIFRYARLHARRRADLHAERVRRNFEPLRNRLPRRARVSHAVGSALHGSGGGGGGQSVLFLVRRFARRNRRRDGTLRNFGWSSRRSRSWTSKAT